MSEPVPALTTRPPAANGAEPPRFFSISQRIGRLRYFTYTLFGMVGCALLLVFVYLLALLLPVDAGRLVSTIAFIVVKSFFVPMIVFVLTMRRVRDFNLSGWWALTVLMPLVTLVFLFIPGTRGENRFGPEPAPNHPGLRFVAIAIPLALLSVYYSLYGGKGVPDIPPQPDVTGNTSSQQPGLKSY